MAVVHPPFFLLPRPHISFGVVASYLIPKVFFKCFPVVADSTYCVYYFSTCYTKLPAQIIYLVILLCGNPLPVAPSSIFHIISHNTLFITNIKNIVPCEAPSQLYNM